MPARFPPPWRAEETGGGYKVVDKDGIALCYIYCGPSRWTGDPTLSPDQGRRLAANIARLPTLLGWQPPPSETKHCAERAGAAEQFQPDPQQPGDRPYDGEKRIERDADQDLDQHR